MRQFPCHLLSLCLTGALLLHTCWGEEEEQAGVDYDVTTSPHYDCYDHLQLHWQEIHYVDDYEVTPFPDYDYNATFEYTFFSNTSGGTLDLEEILKGHKDSGTEISTDAALRSADPSLLLLLLSLTMVQLYRLL